jgi:transposase-like protein
VDTSENGRAPRRHRRTHSAEFKAQVVAACRTPGVSIAAVALEHRLNANLLRRWVTEEERIREARLIVAGNGSPAPPIPASAAFVPVELPRPSVATAQEIVIELRRGATLVKVSWPVGAALACGSWLRALLR